MSGFEPRSDCSALLCRTTAQSEGDQLVRDFLFLFKWPNPALFFVYFLSFQTIFTIKCEKCHVYPVYGAGTRTHDLSNMSCLP